MFIQTEETPNPAALKFLPGRPVLDSGVEDFTNPEAAERSPLARLLFELDGVGGVFLGSDFITVSKTGDKDWQTLKPMVLGAIMDHYTSGAPIMATGAAAAGHHHHHDHSTCGGHHGDEADDPSLSDADVDQEIVATIKELIETRVRPAVAQDGGDIVYKGFKNGTVYLNLRGSCAGCPSSSATLKMGIENMLRHYVPEVLQVEAVA